MRDAAFPDGEGDEHCEAAETGKQDAGRCPAAMWCLDDGPHEQAHAGCDGQVHQEDRAPGEVLEQEAAGHRPECDGGPRHGAPDADRRRPLARVGEDVDEDGQRRGEHECGPDPHERSRPDQLLGGRGEGGERRRGGEQHQAQLECELAAEAVAEVSEGKQQRGEDEGVGVDDHHEQAQPQHGEDRPPGTVDGFRHRWLLQEFELSI